MTTLIYIHIPKTGGNTLTDIMSRQYWPERTRIYKTKGRFIGRAFDDCVSAPEEMPVLALGHMYWGLHELVGPSRYFTMLREPIRRVISQYNHFRNHAVHPLHKAAMSHSLESFLESGICTFMHNTQVRLLSGYSGDGRCTTDMLEAAKRNLDRCVVVGLTERFDESILLMQEAFGWRDPFYLRINVAKKHVDVPKEAYALAHQYNALDAQLYEYAQGMFERQVTPSLGPRLHQFKERNAAARNRMMWKRRRYELRRYFGRVRRSIARRMSPVSIFDRPSDGL